MPGRPTLQAKRAIKLMKEAGFERSDFRVRTDTRYFMHQGVRCIEYGDAMIMPRCPKQKILDLIPNMLRVGLDVHVIILLSGKIAAPHIHECYTPGEMGRIEIWDFRKPHSQWFRYKKFRDGWMH